MFEGLVLAREYHGNLPPHVREYLEQVRGISREIIDLHLLGWNGSRITIPIFDRTDEYLERRHVPLRNEPPDERPAPRAVLAAHLVTNEVILFPSELLEYDSEAKLVEDIRAFIHRYVDVSPLFEQIASYYVLFTWSTTPSTSCRICGCGATPAQGRRAHFSL